MRFFTLFVLISSLPLATAATRADDPDAIAKSLDLKHLDSQSIIDIVAEDGAWGKTAKQLADALKDVLDNDKIPTTLSPEEDKSGLAKLIGLVERALTGATDLLIQPAARAAWLDAHEKLEKRFEILVEAETPGARWKKQHALYTEVLAQLVKMSASKTTQEDVAAPLNIVPAKFWMEAARESQVYRYDQKPIDSTMLLAKVFEDAAATPTGATVESLKAELNKDLRAFLKSVREERTERQYLAWKAFLDLWGNALAEADADDKNVFKLSNAAHLRAAYTQAKDAILSLGSAIDKLHQEAADTGELQAASERGAGLADGNSAGTFSGPPHHARAMSRITRRHYRIMSRIQSRY